MPCMVKAVTNDETGESELRVYEVSDSDADTPAKRNAIIRKIEAELVADGWRFEIPPKLENERH